MNTPICDFVQAYLRSDAVRMHMPGHKGIPFLGMEPMDITEFTGADVLYQAQGIIRESEENASRLFGTAATFYSAEGASLAIRAMLYLVSLFAAKRGEKARIAAGRNAHKVFITAAALLDADVQWIYPEKFSDRTACEITGESLAAFLDGCEKLPTAVYVTSPDYLGNVADIRSLSEVCHRRGVLLIVDNAHGAYLRFLKESRHPMDLGADLCCDSAHKTLPVLTGGAYLHISRNAPAEFRGWAERALSLFASTSPSYLILQSLDLANRYLAQQLPAHLEAAIARWDRVKSTLRDRGFSLMGEEPLKLTLLPKSYGYTGVELAEILENNNIFLEFFDADHVVMMLSPEWGDEIPRRLLDVLFSVPPKAPIPDSVPELPRPVQVVRPHETLFMEFETVDVSESAGRIMASAAVSCPPAIPIVSCGERIDEKAVRAMEYYGLTRVEVLKTC